MSNPTSKLNLVINGTTTQLDIHDANAVDLSSNQTVGGNKEFTGTTTAHDVIPSATDTYNFGSSSYQWNNAYIKSLTINGVACGDILTHNASEFVDVSTAQTIGGVKVFTSPIGIAKASGDVELSIKNTSLSLKANTNSGMDDIRFTDKDNLIVGGLRQSFTNSKVIGMVYSRSYSSDGDSSTQAEFTLATDNQNGINDAYVKCDNFYPNANATINLGTSTNKWKSFNGLNPGALSLPSTKLINVASSITALDGVTTNKFTPQVDGWLLINGTGTANEGFIYVAQGRIGTKSVNNASSNRCAALLPVVAGAEVSVTCKLSTLTWANIATCQGNV